MALRAQILPPWLTRDLRLLLAARVCMSATRSLAGVVVPIYLAVIGFSGLSLGGLFAVVAVSSAGFTAAIGLLSDRLGRKVFIVALPWLAAVSALGFAFTRSPGWLVAFAALGSFGRGAGAGGGAIGPYQPAEQAMLADAVPSEHRNSLFGRVAFASSVGALIGAGPLTALPGLLNRAGLISLEGLASYRLSFFVLAGIAFLAGLLALPLHEPRRAPRPAAARGGIPLKPKLQPLSWWLLRRLWLANGLNGLAVGFFGPFITYWFYRRYGAGPATVGGLYAVINLAAMGANLGAAPVAARLGLVRTISFSRAIQAALMIPMVLAPTFWLAGLVYLLRMVAQRIGLPLRQSYVMGVAPKEDRGALGALSNLPSQACSSLSPTLAGFLFDHVALALPFEIGAAIQGLSTAAFFLFFRRLPPPEERPGGAG